jgi:hypothetical protein
LHFLTGAPLPEREFGFTRKDLVNFLFDENFSAADPYLGVQIQLKVPIVGIGAPARAFLPPVARALNTPILFPEHYEVANAVGTVVGNILIRCQAEILPWVDNQVQLGYHARAGGQQRSYESLEEALRFARQAVGEQAVEQARQAGASSPTLEVEEIPLPGNMIRLVATAAGKPG